MIKKYNELEKYYPNQPNELFKLFRFDIINYFIEKNKYINYLEIGVRSPGACLNRVIAEHKDGVDPTPMGNGEVNYPITSDEFFELIKDHDIKYDIIFIDGLHLYEQTIKDIKNSLNHLTDKGTIVMHDCNPSSYDHQIEEYTIGNPWNGTVWKAFVECRCTMPNLTMSVIDADWGIGVIQRGKQKLWEKDNVKNCQEYSYLEKNREKLLNLIPTEEFEKKYKTGYYEG